MPLVQDQLILVVDDTNTNLEFISDALTRAGYMVSTNINSEKALRQIQECPPDLILLDVVMPGMDGFQVCQRLKADISTCHIPVIFMTAISDTESKVKGFALGAVDYITKPFEEQELLARVNIHLQLRNLNRQLEHLVAERTAELTETLKQLQEFQIQLVQSEKMSALGNLVAGVAHEINNPIGFISGNLQPAASYIQDLFGLIRLYQSHYSPPHPEIQAGIDEINLEYIQEDLPKVIASMKEGISRIRNISISLRVFSRADSDRQVPFNIHEGIDSTLMILKHRLKAVDRRPTITVVKEYSKLPLVECFPGQLNQVFMNLLANAIDAVEEEAEFISQRSDTIPYCPMPKIWIRTELSPDETDVLIHIKDNGVGMSDEVKKRAFDHLFTTKPVGKGTGLGLSIVRQIVVDKHRGSLTYKSVIGIGTEFTLKIPINAVR